MNILHQLTTSLSLTEGPASPKPGTIPKISKVARQIHSHNDYTREIPLYSALAAGARSIEADIWLSGKDLLVGHSKWSLSKKCTLKVMYVDPLVEVLERGGGWVYPSRKGYVEGDETAGVYAAGQTVGEGDGPAAGKVDVAVPVQSDVPAAGKVDAPAHQDVAAHHSATHNLADKAKTAMHRRDSSSSSSSDEEKTKTNTLGQLPDKNVLKAQKKHERSKEETVYLVIDFKSTGPETFDALREELHPLHQRGYLTSFNGTKIVYRAITVIATGRVPYKSILSWKDGREIFYDVPILDLPSFAQDENHGLVSLSTSGNYKKMFGELLPLSSEHKAELHRVVASAHEKDLMVRFWNVDDSAWSTLTEAGVDWINADDFNAAISFLETGIHPTPIRDEL